mmetsp:Transcript_3256/g.4939  ORF Transcript_3256/g.4939 Transcript_3256/m.4939 type:complete len:322 (-) Transcript_3256:300-1265(-)|eukprot:CAMPEP_0194210580 /NCGR_PEP_ID=MMETSP0156-20130528/8762_1 /TAXON_ID=33649 /ORGANISM="Thalassionema nitzschioides, Strain L26-B" /LENGTH=321 /DNA_ID=CAMNT_0038937943 /DNA_START=21 /DNA_END=986 /DNA_ORIENTATION=-
MANPPHALDVTPHAELQFSLSRSSDVASRVTMRLHHAGTTNEHLAFKVKTTQPRRYLVRPNQGLVAPGGTEQVSIMLVDKDKQVLLQSFDRLGQSALDHSKDKFLVQSCAVTEAFAKKYSDDKAKAASKKGDSATQVSKDLAEDLTSMWNNISSGSTTPVFNKKLHVRHTVAEKATDSNTIGNNNVNPAIKIHETPSIENMTPEQMYAEVSSLRRKYDELVSFSVNLTAERDILNNTLEQTKRDLNREIASKGVSDSRSIPSSGSSGSKGSLTAKLIQLCIVSFIFFLAGVKFSNSGRADVLKTVPVVGETLFAESDAKEL